MSTSSDDSSENPSTRPWTALYHQSEEPLEYLFENPHSLLHSNQDAITLYISGCPQLHLFDLLVINVTPEDLNGTVKALWHALYQDDWEEGDYVIRHGSSMLRLKQMYESDGLQSLDIIRHNVLKPTF